MSLVVRLDEAVDELRNAVTAHLSVASHGGSARARADSQARVDAASAEVERLQKAQSLLDGAAGVAAPNAAAPRAAPVPKELSEKPLSEDKFEAGVEEFSRTLRIHGLEVATHWRRLLPMVVPRLHLGWLEQALTSHPNWTFQEGVTALRARMVPARAVLQRQSEFLRLTMDAGETVEEYAKRYHALAIEARRVPDPELWCLTLVPELQQVLQQVRLARAPVGQGIMPLASFDDALTLALECQRAIPPAQSQERPSKESGSKKKAPQPSFMCEKHGRNFTHNTPECRVLQHEKAAAQAGGGYSASRGQKDMSKVTCWRCSARGHYADKCPNPPSTPSANAASVPGSSQEGPDDRAAVYSREDAEWIASMRQIWANSTTGCSANAAPMAPPAPRDSKTNLLRAPVLLDGVKVQGLVDTGASHSLVKEGVAQRLKIKLLNLEAPIGVQVADGKIRKVTRFARASLTIKATQPLEPPKVVVGRLLVLDDLAHELILGLDLLPSLGIEIHGMPDDFPSAAASGDGSPGDPTPRSTDEAWLPPGGGARGLVEHPQRRELLAALQPLIAENQQISPSEVCRHPKAVFSIPTGNAIPTARRQYPIQAALRPFVKKAVEGWLEQGVVQAVAGPPSEWQSPVMAAPKRDPVTKEIVGARVCLDPSHINTVLAETPTATIPLISDIAARTAGAEVISLLDAKSGYNQIPVHEPDRPKTHFVLEGQHFVFMRGPFGFKHFTSAFQHIMECIFHGVHVFIYVDDVVIISRSIGEHIQHVGQVLATANKYRLRFNWEKVQIGFRKLAILGHIVSGQSMEMDPKKMDLLMGIPRPSSGAQVESLLGLASYLRQYIPLYSTLLAPFERVRKVRAITWNQQLEEAWQGLRAIVASSPVLHHAKEGVELEVATDASNVGVGAVLYQTIEGKRHYVMFAAKALNSAQQNYPASKKELLAIVFALRAFDQWLLGRRFTLYTDHQALTFLLTTKNTTQTLRYWHDVMLQYDFKVVHRPGALNALPDAISRLFPQSSRPSSHLRGGEGKPEEIITLFAATQLGMKVPPEADRAELIERTHSQLGHRARDGLYKQLFSEGFCWPSMRQDCQKVAETCDACLTEDIKQHGFHPLSMLERTFPCEMLSIDLFGPLPMSSDGYNYALVVVDAASRYCITRPLHSKTAEEVAASLLLIFWEHGFPRAIRSDRGREFVNLTLGEVAHRAGITLETTPPYSPQSNGSAESHVKLVRQALKKIMLDHQAEPADWPRFLAAAAWAVNSRVTSRHKSRPIELYFGRPSHALAPFDRQGADVSESADSSMQEDQLVKRITWLSEVVWPATRSSTTSHNAKRKAFVDKSRPQQEFNPGDVVMVEAPPRTPKHAPTYSGPFTVLEPHGQLRSAYRLLQSDGTLLPSPVAVQRMKLVSQADTHEEYVVNKILKERHLPGRPTEYLVSWLGYDDQTWEPESSFLSAGGVQTQQLLDYLNQRKKATPPARRASSGRGLLPAPAEV